MIIDESGQLSGVILLFHYLICLVDCVIQDTDEARGNCTSVGGTQPIHIFIEFLAIPSRSYHYKNG